MSKIRFGLDRVASVFLQNNLPTLSVQLGMKKLFLKRFRDLHADRDLFQREVHLARNAKCFRKAGHVIRRETHGSGRRDNRPDLLEDREGRFSVAHGTQSDGKVNIANQFPYVEAVGF